MLNSVFVAVWRRTATINFIQVAGSLSKILMDILEFAICLPIQTNDDILHIMTYNHSVHIWYYLQQ